MALSANDTVIAAGSGRFITDSKGQAWSITASGQVAINGTPDTSTSGVTQLALVNGVIWQQGGNGLWWGNPGLTAGQWGPGAGTISPLPATVPLSAPSQAALSGATSAVSAVTGSITGVSPSVTIQAQIAAVVTMLSEAVSSLTKLSSMLPATTTRSGVPLPAGWGSQQSHVFGTNTGCTISTMAELHAAYYESSYFNRDAAGLVSIPNVVVNNEQQTYGHFEDVMVFSPDHLTIQARGHPDGSISSGEMVSVWTGRSFCIEWKYCIPNVLGAWPAAWIYACMTGADQSELDFEQPIAQYNTVHTVSMDNHPNCTAAQTTIADSDFTTAYMTWTNADFDASTAPHSYTTIYDDTAAGSVSRYIDGKLIYSVAPWKWNASLGGTGHGPDACVLFNLAVGGDWPGPVADPAGFSADLDLYSIDYYGPLV